MKKIWRTISLIFNTIVVLKPTPEAKCLLTHSMSDSQFKNGNLENIESICSPEQTLTIKCSAYINLFFFRSHRWLLINEQFENPFGNLKNLPQM